jgi:hypothetical protein
MTSFAMDTNRNQVSPQESSRIRCLYAMDIDCSVPTAIGWLTSC